MWRTTDNGGDRAFLDKYCNELTGDFAGRSCPVVTWEASGGPGRRPAPGATPATTWSPSSAPPKPGSRTLWAATRKGDLYVSSNANAADPTTVAFTEYDDALDLPNRFVSSIAVDPSNPNHAYLSYSGYSAYSPAGHVYDVTIDPATGTGTAKDISGSSTDGLGDQPVTDLVDSPRRRRSTRRPTSGC